jgi:tetratricopeptide (TPR) repeat protein
MNAWLLLALFAWQNPDYLEQGRKALDAKHNDEAAGLFQKAVEADPKDYAAHFHLALADSLLQHDAEAAVEYQKTLELKPGLYEAQLNLGILLLRDKRAEDAIAVLQNAVAQKPTAYPPNYSLAQALLDSNRAPDAQPYFEAALKAKPTSAEAELGLAHALLKQNQLAAAEPHFRAAGEREPRYREALLELASAEEKASQTTEAIAIYRQFPENAAAQKRVGELLVKSDNYAEAVPRLEKAVAASPTAANRMALADAYRMTKQPVKLDEQLSKAVASEPGNFEYRMVFGRQLRDERQFVAAANQFYAATKLKPDSKDAWNELASVLIIDEDYGAGLAALDRAKALGGETVGGIYFRAITLDKLRQKPLALASYKQFLAASDGKHPDEEFKARQRIRMIETEMGKR